MFNDLPTNNWNDQIHSSIILYNYIERVIIDGKLNYNLKCNR